MLRIIHHTVHHVKGVFCDSVEDGRGVFCAEGRVLQRDRGGAQDDGVPRMRPIRHPARLPRHDHRDTSGEED